MGLVTSLIARLYDHLNHPLTLLRLRTILISARQQSQSLWEIGTSQDEDIQLVRTVKLAEGRSQIADLCIRYAKLKLAAAVDDKREIGHTNASSAIITDLLNRVQKDLAMAGLSSETLHRYLCEGRSWIKLCQGLPSLLCLIPPSHREDLDEKMHKKRTGITHVHFRDLKESDRDELRDLIKKEGSLILRMCKIREEIQQCIWQKKQIVEYGWETMSSEEIFRMSPQAVYTLLHVESTE